jgi:hypothetical protein
VKTVYELFNLLRVTHSSYQRATEPNRVNRRYQEIVVSLFLVIFQIEAVSDRSALDIKFYMVLEISEWRQRGCK